MIYEFVGEIVIICVGIEYMYLLIYVNFLMIYFLYFEKLFNVLCFRFLLLKYILGIVLKFLR